jgi:hypothetical protein
MFFKLSRIEAMGCPLALILHFDYYHVESNLGDMLMKFNTMNVRSVDRMFMLKK